MPTVVLVVVLATAYGVVNWTESARRVEQGHWQGNQYLYDGSEVMNLSEIHRVYRHFDSILVLGCSLSRRLARNIHQVLHSELEETEGMFPVKRLSIDHRDHGTISYGGGLTSVYTPTFTDMIAYIDQIESPPALLILSNGIHDIRGNPDDDTALVSQPGGLAGAPLLFRKLHNAIHRLGNSTLVVLRTEPWNALGRDLSLEELARRMEQSPFHNLTRALKNEFQQGADDVALLDHAKILFNRTLDSTTRLGEGRHHLTSPARYVVLQTLASFLQPFT